ncbi:MAG: iron ABC transporter permease [Thermomicrobiales bacterium]|nr:iron ABC transporter permease [Thermomicrobiales bacterium]
MTTQAEPATTEPVVIAQRSRRSSPRPPASLTLLAGVIATISLLPVAYLLIREGMDPQRLRMLLSTPTTGELVRNTALLAFSVTLCCIVVGVALAVLVTSTDLPARRIWMVLFTLPLGVPAFVASYTWVAASYEWAPQSTFLYGLRGAVLVLTLSLYPYIYLPVVAALRGLDATQEGVARALGRGPALAFFEITLPQLRRAISGGALIVALHMLAEFGALELLRYRTLTTAIMQRATVLGSLDSARALSIVLTFAALLLLAGDGLLFRNTAGPFRIGSGVAQTRTPWRLGRWAPLYLAAGALVVAAALGVPLFGMIRGALVIASGHAAIDGGALVAATVTTIEYGAAAALLVTFAALPISLLMGRYPTRIVLAIERAAWIAHSLPGVVVSLGLVFFAVRWLHPLYQSSTLLVIGYAILYLPIAIGAQRVGIEQAAVQFDQIARTLGRSPIAAFVSVTLPIALPGIVAGIMLVGLNVAKELTMTLLLRPTAAHTLATKLWTTTNGEVLDFTAAAPYAITMIAITAVPTYLLIRTSLSPAKSG